MPSPDPGGGTRRLWTDLGFLAYWVATALGALSVGTDPFLRQWN
ncbi:hypothetical protein [Nocardia amikacinitolerans]|nr:hypothetical protein [Nocardia amikacinitolerans]